MCCDVYNVVPKFRDGAELGPVPGLVTVARPRRHCACAPPLLLGKYADREAAAQRTADPGPGSSATNNNNQHQNLNTHQPQTLGPRILHSSSDLYCVPPSLGSLPSVREKKVGRGEDSLLVIMVTIKGKFSLRAEHIVMNSPDVI